jgi:hypothetical protein
MQHPLLPSLKVETKKRFAKSHFTVMDPATATAHASAATAASVQALVNALYSSDPAAAAASHSHRLSLSSFWKEDPIGWFHYAEAEFAVANVQFNSYVLRAFSPEVIATETTYHYA